MLKEELIQVKKNVGLLLTLNKEVLTKKQVPPNILATKNIQRQREEEERKEKENLMDLEPRGP